METEIKLGVLNHKNKKLIKESQGKRIKIYKDFEKLNLHEQNNK